MPSNPARVRTAGRAAVAIALIAFVAVLTHDVLRGDGLARMDPQIWGWTVAHRTGALTAVARTVTLFGNTSP